MLNAIFLGFCCYSCTSGPTMKKKVNPPMLFFFIKRFHGEMFSSGDRGEERDCPWFLKSLKIFSLFKEVHNGRCVEYKNSFLVKSG
jgi:hypothetical protein